MLGSFFSSFRFDFFFPHLPIKRETLKDMKLENERQFIFFVGRLVCSRAGKSFRSSLGSSNGNPFHLETKPLDRASPVRLEKSVHKTPTPPKLKKERLDSP